MVLPLIAVGAAVTAAACIDCDGDTTENDEQGRIENGEHPSTHESNGAADIEQGRHQQSRPNPGATGTDYRSNRQQLAHRDSSGVSFNQQDELSVGSGGTYDERSSSVRTAPSSVRSVLSRVKSENSGINLKKSNKTKGRETSDYSDLVPGFVNGDFMSGKLFDLHVEERCYCMSQHESLMAVGLLDGTGVALYETRSYSLVSVLEREDAVSALAWLDLDTADGQCLLAVGGLDASVALYSMDPELLELQGAERIHEFQVKGQVRAMSLSRYGKLEPCILLSVGDKMGGVSLSSYSLDSLEHLNTHEVHKHDTGVLGIAVSDSLLAASTKGGEVSVQRIQRDDLGKSITLGYPIWQTTRNGPVRSIAFSNDEKRLVFGGYDMTVAMVDTTLWAIVRELKLDGTINTISYDPLGRYLAVGTRVKSFAIFDTSTYAPIKTLNTPGWVTCVTWGKSSSSFHDSDLVAIRSEPTCISLLDLTPIHQTDVKLMSNRDNYCYTAWSHDGRFLARTNGSKIIISDSLQNFSEVAKVTFKGSTLTCIDYCHAPEMQDRIAVVGLDGNLTILRLLNKSAVTCSLEVVRAVFLEENLWVTAWSPDGSFIVAAGKGKRLHALSTSNYKPRSNPLELEGRVWDIDFMPQTVMEEAGSNGPVYALAASTNTVATLFDINSLQPTLRVLRARTVRCLTFHPFLPLLVIGDGGNYISVIDLLGEETVNEVKVGGRVNTVKFSPTGDLLVAGTDDGCFSIHETSSFKVVQEIQTTGFAMTASFSGCSGRYLALGSSGDDYTIVRLGPFLSTDFIPLLSSEAVKQFPDWALKGTLYRSGDGPSLLQRYMIDGSQESLRTAASILHDNPDCIHTFNRQTNEGCFNTAVQLKKPNLLKLALTTIVDGTLESSEQRSILTTDMPDRGLATLQDMVIHHPPQNIVEILNEMTYIKVPFTGPREVSPTQRQDCCSSDYTDPWGSTPERRLERIKNEIEIDVSERAGFVYRTPAVLPLPGLGTMYFLSSLLKHCPPTVFDNDAMGLVLLVMWRDYTKRYFLVDITLFVIYFCLWAFYVDWTATTTSTTLESLTATEAVTSVLLLLLNSGFAFKEFIQANYGRRRSYWKSLWNLVDCLSILLVYAYVVSTVVRGGVGRGSVPLAVITTLLLTIKVLSYLRGFDSTGWLISVLIQNFRDIRGFIIVLLTILCGFTISFRLLFGDVPGECTVQLEDDSSLGAECAADPFASIARSFLSTFELAVVGAYDSGLFDESAYTALAIIIFITAVICVLVVALNALIAVLSDSYARVQENAVANRRTERAGLIVEYLQLLPAVRRRKIEKNTLYFHALLKADEDGDLVLDREDWQGGLNALRRDMEEFNEHAEETNRQMTEELKTTIDNDIAALRKEVMSVLEDVAEDVKEMKNSRAVTLDGRNVARAVKNVKSIGKKGLGLFGH